jgi:hypothetical protein
MVTTIDTFEQFIELTFNNSPEFSPDNSGDWNQPSPEVMVDFIERMNLNSGKLLENFSDSQIERGIRFLIFAGFSDYYRYIALPEVNLAKRVKAVESIFSLYTQIYNPRCTPISTFANGADLSPLNNSCFMWWDTCPIFGTKDDEIILASLSVLEKTLYLSNIACQEAALHGLGHLAQQPKWQDLARAIMDRFINSSNQSVPALRSYALAAYDGYVQ